MEEKFIQIDGNKIRYLESGNSKKTLVLIHGLGASAERWSQVIPIFAEQFRVVVPDLIGFGYSDKPLVDYTPEFFLDFLEKFFVESKIDCPNIIGSSLGGQLSAEYASSHSQNIEKLVLVSPAGAMKQSTPALDAYIMAALYPNDQSAKNAFEMMEASGEDIEDEIVSGFVERMRLPNAKLAFMSTVLGLKNSELITSKLPSISVPTLIIWGANDPVIPINYADDFVSSIQDCRFFRMDGCGHTPYVQDPNVFASKVLEFLNGI
ncbi:hydrolase, alpha/beta domain protein [Candidatus Nitrosopumilus salaria BD31]|uniref:Hydrolase, alpha/beta domain protein n=1 Tax=Candidatus Nitrosopumilus salarius BD31 TaxID=859350 RepID=I3D2F6_9ARCH|nr:alpha/beta hydrolase [Candidatus Nitrosopumilus salaria]EIJ65899.1 hydrolase, alpha/beta domain protein [Candidatus Nitrosopumilus salaria BD31]